jgi:hypothetical protein
MADISQPQDDIIALLQAVQYQNANLFNFVDIFNDQFAKQDDGEQEAMALPAALVEIVEPIDWNALGGGLMESDLIFRIHIGMEQLDAGDGTMATNRVIFKYRRAVIMALSNQVLTACSPLFWVKDQPSYKHTNKYVYPVDFKCGFIDSSGSPYDPDAGVYIESTPPIGFQGEYSNEDLPNDDGVVPTDKGEYIINPEPQE